MAVHERYHGWFNEGDKHCISIARRSRRGKLEVRFEDRFAGHKTCLVGCLFHVANYLLETHYPRSWIPSVPGLTSILVEIPWAMVILSGRDGYT